MTWRIKIGIIGVVLGISALSLAGWCHIDIQGIKEANAQSIRRLTRRLNVFISQQKNLANGVKKLNEKIHIARQELSKFQTLNLLQEYDLCSLREDNILPGGFLGVDLERCPERRGIAIQKVYSNSPAQAAGLKEGDIVLFYNGDQVWSKEALVCDIQRTRPLSPVEIVVRREGERKRLMAIVIAKR